MEIVIANKFKVPRIDGEHAVEYKKKIASNRKVRKDYVEQQNANTKTSGIMYEIDEKATAEWLKTHKAQVEKRKAAEKLSQQAGMAFVNMMQGVNSSIAAGAVEAPAPEQTPKVNDNPPPAPEADKGGDKPKKLKFMSVKELEEVAKALEGITPEQLEEYGALPNNGERIKFIENFNAE